jgi:hypothetical protein
MSIATTILVVDASNPKAGNFAGRLKLGDAAMMAKIR